jgi:glycogen debranching enzyme
MIGQGYTKAIELLRQSTTDHGFVASPLQQDNYTRVWTRDGVVAGMAALLSNEADLIATFRATLTTIFKHQHPLGFIASHVSDDGAASYGGKVGRVDNPSWAVLGLCQYALVTGDISIAQIYEQHVVKCLHVLDVWEYNGRHLVYAPQSGNWADEYFYHGYLLFDQLLRLWALRLAARTYNRNDWEQKANHIQETVELNFWYHERRGDDFYASNMWHQLKSAPKQFWHMGFNPSRIYHQFDLQANALALILGIGSSVEQTTCADYVSNFLNECGTILPCFHPAVTDNDAEMADLKTNFAFRFRNLPYEFQNGGLWPVWNGFMAAGLAAGGHVATTKKFVQLIHQSNSMDNWDFNECHHGRANTPTGMRRCTWSAAGAVIGEKSVAGVFLLAR